MPTDYELYYGFTRFAIELNELCPELKDVLPRTDARFRPDQRYSITFSAAIMGPDNTMMLHLTGKKVEEISHKVDCNISEVNLLIIMFLSDDVLLKKLKY